MYFANETNLLMFYVITVLGNKENASNLVVVYSLLFILFCITLSLQCP